MLTQIVFFALWPNLSSWFGPNTLPFVHRLEDSHADKFEFALTSFFVRHPGSDDQIGVSIRAGKLTTMSRMGLGGQTTAVKENECVALVRQLEVPVGWT
ncbi:MAG: hypothetical protein U9R25_17830 [Chloroflexota bacterium]|nr:hypothetical protein [Chloroflexota bacterium]